MLQTEVSTLRSNVNVSDADEAGNANSTSWTEEWNRVAPILRFGMGWYRSNYLLFVDGASFSDLQLVAWFFLPISLLPSAIGMSLTAFFTLWVGAVLLSLVVRRFVAPSRWLYRIAELVMKTVSLQEWWWQMRVRLVVVYYVVLESNIVALCKDFRLRVIDGVAIANSISTVVVLAFVLICLVASFRSFWALVWALSVGIVLESLPPLQARFVVPICASVAGEPASCDYR